MGRASSSIVVDVVVDVIGDGDGDVGRSP